MQGGLTHDSSSSSLPSYSSGAVHCWTLGDADGPVSVSMSSPPPPSPPSCCALSHGWAVVGTKNGEYEWGTVMGHLILFRSRFMMH